MTIRDYKKEDKDQAEEIFVMYWNDKEFRKKLLEKLDIFVEKGEEYNKNQYRFYVAEEGGEIVGIAGFRKAPEHMSQFAVTDNPAEFYILASKYKGKGVGEALRLKRLEEVKKMGFTEVVLYSPDTHEESWGFHDRMGFERVGPAVAPDGEPGMIWRKVLT